MDLDFMFFRLPGAIRLMFKINYIPRKEDFKELTPEQYTSFHKKASEETVNASADEKVLAFLPEDTQVYNRVVKVFGDDLLVVSESQRAAFDEVSQYIDASCDKSGKTFKTLTEKLAYMAEFLPSPYSEGTPYAIHGKKGLKKK